MFNAQIRAAFEQRINENYQQKLAEWRQLSPYELIDRAEDIYVSTMMRNQTPICVTDETAAYLLRFADPLQMVSDAWIMINGNTLIHEEEICGRISWLQDSGYGEQNYELAPGFRPDPSADKILSPEVEQDLLDKIIGYMGEYFDGSQLYDILHNTLEMSHEEMEGLGFDLHEYYETPTLGMEMQQ